MICLSPLLVNITPSHDNFRKKVVQFNPEFPIVANDCLPCGRCLNCRLHYMHEWGRRCEHEALFSHANFFVTLTYNPENLPTDSSLCQQDFTLFVKRVRKYFAGNSKSYIRYFACGEYGTFNRRPHYHALFFNLPLTDLFYFGNIKGVRYHRSLALESLWNKGFVLIGPVNYESAAYVAGYTLKKQKGRARTFAYKDLSTDKISTFRTENSPLAIPLADYKPKPHILRRGKVLADLSTAYDVKTGELIFPDLLDSECNSLYDPLATDIRILEDEFAVMSLKPGIGAAYYEKYKHEMFINGFSIHKSKKVPILKSYLRKYFAECSDDDFRHTQAAIQRFNHSMGPLQGFDPDVFERKMKSVQKRFEMFHSPRYV